MSAASRTFSGRAHAPQGRVVHAIRLDYGQSVKQPEAVTACGRSLGIDYTVEGPDHENEPAPVSCRSCRRTI